MFSLITHNVVSMRAEPRNGSEQISQAILGDRMEILEEQGDVAFVRAPDAYEGWILRQHLRPISPEDPSSVFSSALPVRGAPYEREMPNALTPQRPDVRIFNSGPAGV